MRLRLANLKQFDIRESHRGLQPSTAVPPDLPVCEDCLRELFDPAESTLSVPLYRLHELRPAVLTEHRIAIRPRVDDHGRMADVCGLRAMSFTIRATAASTRSRLLVHGVDRTIDSLPAIDCIIATGRSGRPRGFWQLDTSSASRVSADITSRAMRRMRRLSTGYALASTARRRRSRSWRGMSMPHAVVSTLSLDARIDY